MCPSNNTRNTKLRIEKYFFLSARIEKYDEDGAWCLGNVSPSSFQAKHGDSHNICV